MGMDGTDKFHSKLFLKVSDVKNCHPRVEQACDKAIEVFDIRI